MPEVIQRLRYYSGHVKVLFALAGILVAGALLGGTIVAAHYREALQQEREVNRGMFAELAEKLEVLGKRIDGTATTQAETADKLQDATTTVSDVVEKVDLAAAKADKAAKAAAAKVAKAAPATPPPAAVQPDVVNREIRKANEKLKERTVR